MNKNFGPNVSVKPAALARGTTRKFILPEPVSKMRTLPDRFVGWFNGLLFDEAPYLHPRRRGIEVLEPRILLSGDPLSASFAMVADGRATLRVVEVEYASDPHELGSSKEKERRLQLFGVNASGVDAVLGEARIIKIDGQDRIVTDAVGTANPQALDFITVTGTAQNNLLAIDASVLDLHDIVQINVNLMGGVNEIEGPAASAALIWSLDGTGLGELAVLQPTGDIEDPEADNGLIDVRVSYDFDYGSANAFASFGGDARDQFLTFAGVDSINAQSTRDVVVDRISVASEWKVTWSESSTSFEKFSVGTSVDGSADLTARATVFAVEGVEAFRGVEQAHLNLGFETRTASEAGADINAESGELRLLQSDDSDRNNPLIVDIRGVTAITGTQGKDFARAARGVDIDLLGGQDILDGNDDLLDWTINSISAAGLALPEAQIALDYFVLKTNPATPAENLDWETLNVASSFWGVDEIRGSDNADRIRFDHGRNIVAKATSTEENIEWLVTSVGSTHLAFSLMNIEEIHALEAETAGNYSTLDYSALLVAPENEGDITTEIASVDVDLSIGISTGLDAVSGFGGVITGSADDQVTANATTQRIQTGGGADEITLAVAQLALSVDAGTGTDTLFGEPDGRSLETAATDPDTPITTHFLVNSLIGAGSASGVVTTFGTTLFIKDKSIGEDGDPDYYVGTDIATYVETTQTGAAVSFQSVEAIEGAGGGDDPDKLSVELSASGSALVWNVTDVYEGVIEFAAAKLAYAGIARGQSNSASVPDVVLSYAGFGTDPEATDYIAE